MQSRSKQASLWYCPTLRYAVFVEGKGAELDVSSGGDGASSSGSRGRAAPRSQLVAATTSSSTRSVRNDTSRTQSARRQAQCTLSTGRVRGLRFLAFFASTSIRLRAGGKMSSGATCSRVTWRERNGRLRSGLPDSKGTVHEPCELAFNKSFRSRGRGRLYLSEKRVADSNR
jgi:hypothetical protein